MQHLCTSLCVVDDHQLIVDNRQLVVNNHWLIVDNQQLIVDNSQLIANNRQLIVDKTISGGDESGHMTSTKKSPGFPTARRKDCLAAARSRR